MKHSNLSAEQQAALKGYRSRVIIAGPGSGKTHTITTYIVDCLNSRAIGNEIVAITFTNAAAQELSRRIDESFARHVRLRYCGTIHGLCLAALRWSTGEEVTVLDEEAADRYLEETIATLRLEKKVTIKKAKQALETMLHFLATPAKAPKMTTPAELVAASFRSNLLRDGLYTFDMIQQEGLDAVRRWVGPIKLLVVDEIQDSSPLDYEIFEAIPAAQRIYIGDPNQAIYGFRGASLAGIQKARERYEVKTLQDNYRSSAAVCSAANALMWDAQNQTRPVTGRQGSCILNQYGTDTEEIDGVAQKIQLLIREGEPPEEIAILARKRALVHAVAQVLNAQGVKTAERTVEELPSDWGRCVATLELFNRPTNWFIQRNWVLEAFGPEKGKEILRKAQLKGQPPIQGLGTPELPVPNQWDHVLDSLARFGIELESIDRVKRIARDLEEPSIAAILLENARMAVPLRTERLGVTCTTFHSSKGLEWQHVFLIGIEQGIIPMRSQDSEEERRLLYVAITRAKENLTLSCCQTRRETWGRKSLAEAEPSCFVEILKRHESTI